MAVVILKWNPGVSSWSTFDHVARIVKNNKEPDPKMNWSIHEYEKVKKGDKCFLLKVGYGLNGIVDAGVILSKPYNSRDWSDEGRDSVFYADFESRIILNYDTVPVLTSEELEKAIPDFDWHKGHSGAVLSENQASKFLELWENFLDKNKKAFIEKLDNKRIDSVFWNSKDLEAARKKLEKELIEKNGREAKLSYCSVRIGPTDKTLYYIDPTGTLKTGDYVKIPYGLRNYTLNGIIDSVSKFTKAKVPFPVTRTKCIIEKIENPDPALIESLRQPLGEEVYKWKNFVSNLKELETNRYIYLCFKKDGKRYFFSIKNYSPKILITVEGDVKEDVEIYKNRDDFLKAELFNKGKLKDMWDNLYDYFIEWDD